MTEATTTPKPTAADATRTFLNRKRDGVLERIVSLGAKIAASKPAQALKAAEAELAEIDALLGKLETSSGPAGVSPTSTPVPNSAAGAAAETAPATYKFDENIDRSDFTGAGTIPGRRGRMGDREAPGGGQQRELPAHVAADDAGPVPEAMRRG